MSRSKRRYGLAVLLAVLSSLLLAAGASAATVVNGDFETGNFTGWQVYNSSNKGNWLVYSASEVAEKDEGESPPPFFPPSGNYGAYTDEVSPDTAILYQDVALEPFATHRLAMALGYVSYAPIVAAPTLQTGFPGENQQLRVDVMKPTAPIESLSPSDILTTVFANQTGDPMVMSPRTIEADLSSFAGQTVRIRIANAVNDEVFNTSLDNVTLTSVPISNTITRGKLILNKKSGRAKLTINVPGAGALTLAKGKKTKPANLTSTGPAALLVPVTPNGAGLKVLKKKGKLKVNLAVTFSPLGGQPNTQTYKVTLKKTLKK